MIRIDVSALKRGKINMIQIDIPMPENYSECAFLQYGFCILHGGVPAHKIDEKKRPNWCPLMEVPDDLH